ncbi:uncharacterized protein LOC110266453 isoform X2 [Arachis ipaensis]|nr:uncharacterized protein LOC110266453 isoform X2 [Arachis ipaensis]XP_025679471.1 uncharacterized protein LOC112779420 isoform X2 [Arachis hypogaea]
MVVNELDKTLHHQIRSHFLKEKVRLTKWYAPCSRKERSKVAFAKRADLRMANILHKMSSLVGGMLFVGDDLYIHTAWHLATVIGVSNCNMLLEQCFRSNAKEIDFIKDTPKTTTMALLVRNCFL